MSRQAEIISTIISIKIYNVIINQYFMTFILTKNIRLINIVSGIWNQISFLTVLAVLFGRNRGDFSPVLMPGNSFNFLRCSEELHEDGGLVFFGRKVCQTSGPKHWVVAGGRHIFFEFCLIKASDEITGRRKGKEEPSAFPTDR